MSGGGTGRPTPRRRSFTYSVDQIQVSWGGLTLAGYADAHYVEAAEAIVESQPRVWTFECLPVEFECLEPDPTAPLEIDVTERIPE